VVRVTKNCPFSGNELSVYLMGHGVGTAIHYLIELPEQPGISSEDLQVVKKLFNGIVPSEEKQVCQK
jgi:hypothetical protein